MSIFKKKQSLTLNTGQHAKDMVTKYVAFLLDNYAIAKSVQDSLDRALTTEQQENVLHAIQTDTTNRLKGDEKEAARILLENVRNPGDVLRSKVDSYSNASHRDVSDNTGLKFQSLADRLVDYAQGTMKLRLLFDANKELTSNLEKYGLRKKATEKLQPSIILRGSDGEQLEFFTDKETKVVLEKAGCTYDGIMVLAQRLKENDPFVKKLN